MSELLALARWPRSGTALVLQNGRFLVAAALVTIATVFAEIAASRFASEVHSEDLFFAQTRSPFVSLLLGAVGVERTTVIIYLLQRAFDAVVVAIAITPLFIWLLGSSAVHAAARLQGIKRPYLPMLVLFGYASALTRIPSDLATIALGTGRGAGAQVAQLVGSAALVWLGVLAFRGIQSHYAVAGGRAVVIFVVSIVFFYLVPLLLIVAAAVAIVVAAVVLEYF